MGGVNTSEAARGCRTTMLYLALQVRAREGGIVRLQVNRQVYYSAYFSLGGIYSSQTKGKVTRTRGGRDQMVKASYCTRVQYKPVLVIFHFYFFFFVKSFGSWRVSYWTISVSPLLGVVGAHGQPHWLCSGERKLSHNVACIV